ncbi:MAG: hypothetical protein ACI316_02090 [Lactimicrobium massiliense]
MDCGDILCACGNDARINKVAEQTDDTAVCDDRKLPCLDGTNLAMGDTGSFCVMDLLTIMQHSVFIILKWLRVDMPAHFFICFTDKVRALCKAAAVTEERIAIDEAAVDIFPEDPNLGIVKDGADFRIPQGIKKGA